MKKALFFIMAILFPVLSLFTGCELFGKQSDDEGGEALSNNKNSISMSLSDITLDVGDEAQLIESVTVGEKTLELEYVFHGDAISISEY